MDREYFNEYYFLERNHWWFKVRKQILKLQIQKHFNVNSGIKILNIGSATGATSELLQKFGDVESVEYDRDCTKFYSKISGKLTINSSVLELPFKEKVFDLVCAFDVIEHVEDDKMAVAEMFRVCKENGIVFVTVPAFNFLWSEHDVVNRHFRRYTKNNLNRIFNEQSNSSVCTSSYFNSLLFPLIAGFRIVSGILPNKLFRKGAGSDFTVVNNDSVINKIFYRIFMLESYILNYITFPFGVSLLLTSKKSR